MGREWHIVANQLLFSKSEIKLEIGYHYKGLIFGFCIKTENNPPNISRWIILYSFIL